MTVLRASPFNLIFEEYVVVEVRANNYLGWGPYSSPNALVTQIENEPAQMGLVRRGPLTSTTIIDVMWDQLISSMQTGHSPIRSYNLEWD